MRQSDAAGRPLAIRRRITETLLGMSAGTFKVKRNDRYEDMKGRNFAMKSMILGAGFAIAAALPAAAEMVRVESNADTAATMDALQAAVEGAGATIFARVDHGAGAVSVGSDIGGSQLLIFGNPALGTPAMQADRMAGLVLPLKVLVYEDTDGQTWLAYEDPAAMFEGMDVPADAEFIGKMQGALANFIAAAAGS